MTNLGWAGTSPPVLTHLRGEMIYSFLELLLRFCSFTCSLSRHPNRALWVCPAVLFPACSVHFRTYSRIGPSSSSSSLLPSPYSSSRFFCPCSCLLSPPAPVSSTVPFSLPLPQPPSPLPTSPPPLLRSLLSLRCFLLPHCLLGCHSQPEKTWGGGGGGGSSYLWASGERGGVEGGAEVPPAQVAALGAGSFVGFSLTFRCFGKQVYRYPWFRVTSRQ